jgi:glyoxylase-like metal-dependent hydrolase (beta-lactamase superfamily II)
MISQITPDIFSIKIRLVGNPLRDLNSYVFLGKERNLLIDTGFNQPECLEDLRTGIRELNLDMNKTDVFLTHGHADHSGLVGQIISDSSNVYMGEFDKTWIENRWVDSKSYKHDIAPRYLGEGFPTEEFSRAFSENPSTSLAAAKPYAITAVKEGHVFTVGGRNLTCIHTPGHTPGHICLYEPHEKIMVLGDHVLFDISPNITMWPMLSNALKHYLESLKKIRDYDVELPLPAHRECHCTMHQRIDELLAHHDNRLAETVRIIAADPGVNGYNVAARLTWSIRAKNWQEFPIAQKWFAFGETLSHLDYLVGEGTIRREVRNGLVGYTLS